MKRYFTNVIKLINVILPFNTKKVNKWNEMFFGCENLKDLGLSSFGFNENINFEEQKFLEGCKKLKKIKVKKIYYLLFNKFYGKMINVYS